MNPTGPTRGQSRCLGGLGPTLYFIPEDYGQIVTYSAGQLQKNNLMMLAPIGWYKQHFPHGNGVWWDGVVDAIVSESKKIGTYRPGRLRGRGFWRDDDKPQIHLGDRLNGIQRGRQGLPGAGAYFNGRLPPHPLVEFAGKRATLGPQDVGPSVTSKSIAVPTAMRQVAPNKGDADSPMRTLDDHTTRTTGLSTVAQSGLSAQNRPRVADPDLFSEILAHLARCPQVAMTPWERWRKMRKMGLVPGDELDEQFMSRSADRTDRELADHKAAKRYAEEEEALGYDRRMSYRVAQVVMAEWRPTTLPLTSEVGLGAGNSDHGAGGSDHGCRDRSSGDTDDTDPDWDAISPEIYGWMPPDARVDPDGRIFG